MTTNNLRRYSRLIAFTLTFGFALAGFSVEDCKSLGFNKPNLMCSTCDKINKTTLTDVREKCTECCMKDDDDGALSSKRFPKAVLEVCTCKFGAYPQIQAFVKSDWSKKYKNLEIKYVRGLDPIIKLYNTENKVEDELDIHKWDTDEVHEFLQTRLLLD